MLSYYVIYYEKFGKVMQQTEKEALNNYIKKLNRYYRLQNRALLKATFSFHKLILKYAQMTTLYTNWTLYITFTMIYYVRLI